MLFATTVRENSKRARREMRMLKDPKEKLPTETPGWPYASTSRIVNIRDPYECPVVAEGIGQCEGRRGHAGEHVFRHKEEKMKLSIRVNHGALIEAVTLTQEHADILDVMRHLKDFLSGREIKSVSITIEEKTRHD
jgi:hypothetical protein